MIKMIESKHYSDNFYKDRSGGSYLSAKEVLPIVNEIFRPNSVIDFGCGMGDWLRVWNEELGVKNIKGVEGPYIPREKLSIDPEKVEFRDLKQPFSPEHRFDLAMSLEVGEHLPFQNAEDFILSLTSSSDVVLFSAAVQGQQGTYHINEQMPEYWARFFLNRGYVVVDYLRPKIWNNTKVEWWYKQNILLYIKKERLSDFPRLMEAYKNTSPDYLFRIHPDFFQYKLTQIEKTRSLIGYLRWRLYPVKKFLKKKLFK